MAGATALQAALPDYEISTELGRGAMGIVYLGRHRNLGRTVAIKELPASFAEDATVRERFLTEARTVASLNHPHVVVIHDFVDRDGHLALVMEHLPNGTVWDQFVRQGLAGPRSVGLTLATLAGLSHAHDRGVMHRDIKPENLIYSGDWQLKVTDFGIAQVLTGTETMSTLEGAIVGTPAYMAPEQAEGRTCGPPADVYASAAMLYEMLSGALPFDGHTDAMAMATARLTEDPVPLMSVAPNVPAPIAEVTMRGLSRSESDRWPTAEAFGVALGNAAADAWGVDWMSSSGTIVQGSPIIEEAARTTTHPISPPRPVEPAPSDPPAADAATGAPPVPADSPPPVPAPTPAVAATLAAASAASVQPRKVDRVAGADLNALAPADIVKLREIRKPPSVLPVLVVALGLLAAAAWAIVTGFGTDPVPVDAAAVQVFGDDVRGEAPVVDFTESTTISGLPTGPVNATLLGVPLGSGRIDGAVFDPGYLRWTAAGLVELSPSSATASVPVRTGNDVWLTAPFVVAAVLALGGLASVSSNLRAMRSRRLRVGAYLGLLSSGALAGASLSVLAMLVLETPTNRGALVVAAVLGALAAVATGEAYRRFRRRRRLKRLRVATARR